MAALLAGIGPGDEVVMPSFTFVSTANAFVLRGATPVFVDVREDTLNLDETLVEAAVTDRTRAIVPVHYAGVGVRHGRSSRARRRHGLHVIEDAAQGTRGATLDGRRARHVSASSRRSASTRRRTSSAARAGRCSSTTRRWSSAPRSSARRARTDARFFRGEVDKYTWVDIGSSFPAERARGRVPLGPARAGRLAITSSAWRSGSATTRASRELEARRAAAAARSSRRARGTTPTSTTCCFPTRTAAAR